MVSEVIVQLSVILALAACATIIARIVRQPPIIAYLLAGVLAGPLFFGLLNPSQSTSQVVDIFAHLGVALLLFIVGLSLDFRVLKEIGGVATFAGVAQVIVAGVAGFFIATTFGFAAIPALYLSIALAFSSTVVVVKILSDKREIETLHGKIALGILIVQDFIAALMLMAVPILNQNGEASSIALQIGFAILLIIGIFLASQFFLMRVIGYLAQSQETLFLFGIAWALIIATAFDKLGFSLEIGALVAGMSLASSKYALEFSGKIKPLRDFFVVSFFVFFGSQLAAPITWSLLERALIISLLVIVGKTLIIMTTLRIFGYKKRTNFLVGTSIAQISEFSLILILLGFSLGHLSQEIMSLVILVAIITIGISSYLIYYSHSLFKRVSHLLNIFEGNRNSTNEKKEEPYEIILLGYHRVGYKILKSLLTLKKPILVADYNPKVVRGLERMRIPVFFGDAGDKNFLSELPFEKAKLVISTIPDKEVNNTIEKMLKETGSKATFIATVDSPRNAFDLYKEGVDYVLIPQHLGGEYAAEMIKEFGIQKEKYRELGKKHKKELQEGKNNSTYS